VNVTISAEKATAFGETLAGEEYAREERDYKWAVHLVISALLGKATLQREDLGRLITQTFSSSLPDLDDLGLSPDHQALVMKGLKASSTSGLRNAMGNLSGGRFGIAQFLWIPKVAEFDLEGNIADAFRDLVDESVGVPERIDSFRQELAEIMRELERRGGFEPGWTQFTPSLSFVAMILGAYDPTQFSFYAAGVLRQGFETFAQGHEWPKGSAGTRYVGVCDFVHSVFGELATRGIPVKDMIDAQSFIWLSADSHEVEVTGTSSGESKEGAVLDVELVVKDLSKVLYWPEERARKLVQKARRWNQLLFQGPPGTGKTFVAQALAQLLSGDDGGAVEIVQFHPSYSYEDFVEGIRPTVNKGSDLAYQVQKGVFLKLVEQAVQFPEVQFFLIVDEINRANLPRVFGELLFALEYRGDEHQFRLPYSGEQAFVPNNITVIGTMNSADRSISHVDVAIRRRFRHVVFTPDTHALKGWLIDHGLAGMADTAADALDALNSELSELLDVDRLIGQTYLMRSDLGDVGLRAVWDDDIEPVLNEHFFNQPDEVLRLRGVFLGL